MNKNVIKRINITLPEKTIQKIDKIVKDGKISQFVDKAVNFYVEQKGKVQLKKSMKEGSIKRAQRDLEICDEWFLIGDQLIKRDYQKNRFY